MSEYRVRWLFCSRPPQFPVYGTIMGEIYATDRKGPFRQPLTYKMVIDFTFILKGCLLSKFIHWFLISIFK